MNLGIDGPKRALKRLPEGVWALGFVSLFMDVSSEAIHSLLPVFLVSALGASVTTVGLIEGVAEATASITKVFSGTLSDWLGKRKGLAVVGYGLAALTKPVFAWAPSVEWVFAARFVDRIGKGVRGAPRDALIADITPGELRGAGYGLRQALDTVGAFGGPLLAVALMASANENFRLVFWVAVIPAVISVLVLLFGVKEPAHERHETVEPGGRRNPLGRRYWLLIGVLALFTLARFSEAFLVLKVTAVGLAATYAPFVFVVMNASYALSAYPVGFAADHVDRWGLLAIGFAFLLIADLLLAWTSAVSLALLGIALWGLHLGFTQGVFSALVADAVPAGRRGAAFGVFNFVTGMVLLGASLLAGALWDRYGAAGTFLAGAAITALAGVVAIGFYRGGQLRQPSAA
jgi:MFS family permease